MTLQCKRKLKFFNYTRKKFQTFKRYEDTSVLQCASTSGTIHNDARKKQHLKSLMVMRVHCKHFRTKNLRLPRVWNNRIKVNGHMAFILKRETSDNNQASIHKSKRILIIVDYFNDVPGLSQSHTIPTQRYNCVVHLHLYSIQVRWSDKHR